MTPYFVKRGEVCSGSKVYAAGEALPPGVGDSAMREAGAIEWREPEKREPKAAPKKAVRKPKAVT